MFDAVTSSGIQLRRATVLKAIQCTAKLDGRPSGRKALLPWLYPSETQAPMVPTLPSYKLNRGAREASGSAVCRGTVHSEAADALSVFSQLVAGRERPLDTT